MDIHKLLADNKIKNLCLNASDIHKGDVFVALKGQTTHGIKYAYEAIKNGCCMVLVDTKDFNDNIKYDVPCIKLDNLKQHLPTLASQCYPDAKNKKIIGITGTNGKTSVGFFIHQLLNKLGKKNIFIGTLGLISNKTHLTTKVSTTTPDIFNLYKTLNECDSEYVVLEVSSHALEQGRVLGLNFIQAIFTNLSQDHLDYHHNMDNYRKTKTKLFSLASLKTVIVNRDDVNHKYFLNAAESKKQITYGLADFKKNIANEYGFLCQLDNFVFEIPLLGGFNLSNILAALNSVQELGFERNKIILLLPKLLPPLGRMHKINTSPIWVDYAHTPDALQNAIITLKEHYPHYKIRLLFGCGGNRDKDKRAKMGKVANKLASSIVLTNDNPRDENPQNIIDDILSGISMIDKVDIIMDRKLAIENAITTLREDECLLIAGKGHETTQQFKNKITDLNDIKIANKIVKTSN